LVVSFGGDEDAHGLPRETPVGRGVGHPGGGQHAPDGRGREAEHPHPSDEVVPAHCAADQVADGVPCLCVATIDVLVHPKPSLARTARATNAKFAATLVLLW